MVQKHKKFWGKLEEGTICSCGISISIFSDTQTKGYFCYLIVILCTNVNCSDNLIGK
jgi:hypothetical protein